MASGPDFTTTTLGVIGPTALQLQRSGPKQSLPPLANSPLGLRPLLDDGSGPCRLALSLRLERSDGSPLPGALVLLRLEEPGDAGAPRPTLRGAAQVADDVGFLCFVWSQDTLAAARRPLMCLDIHLADGHGVTASASTCLRLGEPTDPRARHGLARVRLQLIEDCQP